MTEDHARYDADRPEDGTAELPDPDVVYRDGEVDPDAARLGMTSEGKRPAPLGLAIGVSAAMVSVYGVFEANDLLALLPIPVVFLGGLMAGAGFPRGR